MLDEAGLHYVKIIVSNQLDETIIKSLLDQGAPINAFGVGTNLVTGQDTPALDGVYKLCRFNGEPCLKISENITKTSLPGAKKIVRYTDPDGFFYADGILLEEEKAWNSSTIPFFPNKKAAWPIVFPRASFLKLWRKERSRPVFRLGKRRITPNKGSPNFPPSASALRTPISTRWASAPSSWI